ncbi:MAG: AAA family ATPase [Acidobacteria bacterium]|nr:AAA family ATPase [Acidobacteriota bacterium]
MYLERHLAINLRRAAHDREPVLLHGPRGSGKTTLLLREFPDYLYITLNDPTDRARARRDPPGFLSRLRQPTILDDIHRAPELAAIIPLTALPLLAASSLRLTLPIPTLELHAPTHAERQRRPALSLDIIGRFAPSKLTPTAETEPWPTNAHLLDSDIRSLIHLHDIDRFYEFLAIAQQHTAQVLDQQVLAREAVISHRTAVRWLQALDSCFLTVRLQPSTLDFGRRLVRRPKLHFLHATAFESEAVSELHRNASHAGLAPRFRHWRDSNGFEIPLVIEPETGGPIPVAIAEKPNPTIESGLHRWMRLAAVKEAALITRAVAAPDRRAGRLLRYSISQL